MTRFARHLMLLAAGTAGLTAVLLAGSSRPARLVRAEISIRGEVVLRSSTSDDGSPDADAVWNYLRDLRFTATEVATDLVEIDPDDDELELLGEATGQTSRSGDPIRAATLSLRVTYGGEVDLRQLRLTRAPSDGRGGEWCVEPRTVERWFDLRKITRRQARELEDPDRRK